MELRPTAQDISARNAYLEAQEVASRQRAIAEREKELAAEAAREKEARRSRYTTARKQLSDAATPIEYQQFLGKGTELLGAWATEWVPLPSRSPDSSLMAEGRYLTLDYLNTRLDHNHQKVQLRTGASYIEVRWSDAGIDYTGEPRRLLRLDSDELILLDYNGDHRYSLTSPTFTDQSSLYDVLETIIDPMVNTLQHPELFTEQLPLE